MNLTRPRARYGSVCVLSLTVVLLLGLSAPAVAGNWKTLVTMPTPEANSQIGATNSVLPVAEGASVGTTDNLQASSNLKNTFISLETDGHADLCLANYNQCMKGCDGATSCSNQCKVNYDACMKQ